MDQIWVGHIWYRSHRFLLFPFFDLLEDKFLKLALARENLPISS